MKSTNAILYALTAAFSAFLLFLLEPMFAKLILPLLGGAANVWITAMMFYQVMLLAGYGYATAALSRARSFRFMERWLWRFQYPRRRSTPCLRWAGSG
jgi:hypothetical protein